MKKSIILLGAVFLLGQVSCSHKQSSTPDECLKWNMKMLVEGYNNVGSKNPKWDETVKEILTEFARIKAGSDYELETRYELLGERTTEALKAGCDDPLIKYLHCRYGMSNAKFSDWQTQFKSSAKSLENSAYAPLLKFYGDIRASNALWQNRKTNLWNDVHELRMNAIGLLSAALEDKTMPIEEVSQACQLMIESASSKYQLTNAYFAIEKPLFKNWPHASVSYFTKGRFYFEFAWRQRGGGYADSISSNAWASFAANLAIAEKAYQKAWSLNPKDVRIPVQMIEMAVSQQKKRPEMELWFQRAMQLNTNNYEACLKKLRYLNPKWYGTREDMIKFGRQCVASTNWGGRVPMILVEAHSQLAGYFPRDQRDRYWQIPGVWPDIKSAYEKIFQLNPEAKNFRSYYANYAFKCGQWAEFLNQIKLLQKSEEGLNPEFWGTREKFDEMVQFATEHSQKN